MSLRVKWNQHHLSGCRWQSSLPHSQLLWSRLYHHRPGLWPELWPQGCWVQRPRKQMYDICTEKFNKCKKVRIHTDSRQKIVHTVKSISSLIRLMAVAFTCHYDLTYPLRLPDQRQMIMSTGILKSLNKWCFQTQSPQWAISSRAF